MVAILENLGTIIIHKSLYELWYHFESKSQVVEAWISSEHCQVNWRPRKSTASQLWIWRWEVIRNTSFMSKQVSFDISNIKIEEFEVRSRLSKNSRWPIIWTFQKWQGFGPTSTQYYIIQKASNEILSNMKVEDISLPFPKSPRSWISNVWLRRYDPIMEKSAW